MNDRVMIVDDDPDAREVYTTKLEASGYEVEGAGSAEDALGRVKAFDPAVIITDLRMPGMDGLELLERVREHLETVDVIVVTGHEDMRSAVEAMKAGAFDYIVKPINLKELEAAVERCLAEQRLVRESDEAGEEPEEEEADSDRPMVVGRTPRMIEIFKMIGVLARNRATVLVRGETGTGKEVIARAIHAHSIHSEAPFIAVNCTALSDTLLESELFGHVKGAFTGAVASRRGYFELAGSGTIFLDEIGDTSPEFQTKLLRVLQERKFYPVGGESPKTTEARVIAATHQNLERLVRTGEFREDLYFRLKVVEIPVPPLRERKDDIEILVDHLLERIRAETRQDVRQISEGAMERLLEYHWPGNVRELENALTRAAIQARGPAIGAEHLSLGAERLFAEPAPRGRLGQGRSLNAVIADHVSRILEEVSGDRSEAARILEVSTSELDRLIRDHDLEVPTRPGASA